MSAIEDFISKTVKMQADARRQFDRLAQLSMLASNSERNVLTRVLSKLIVEHVAIFRSLRESIRNLAVWRPTPSFLRTFETEADRQEPENGLQTSTFSQPEKTLAPPNAGPQELGAPGAALQSDSLIPIVAAASQAVGNGVVNALLPSYQTTSEEVLEPTSSSPGGVQNEGRTGAAEPSSSSQQNGVARSFFSTQLFAMLAAGAEISLPSVISSTSLSVQNPFPLARRSISPLTRPLQGHPKSQTFAPKNARPEVIGVDSPLVPLLSVEAVVGALNSFREMVSNIQPGKFTRPFHPVFAELAAVGSPAIFGETLLPFASGEESQSGTSLFVNEPSSTIFANETPIASAAAEDSSAKATNSQTLRPQNDGLKEANLGKEQDTILQNSQNADEFRHHFPHTAPVLMLAGAALSLPTLGTLLNSLNLRVGQGKDSNNLLPPALVGAKSFHQSLAPSLQNMNKMISQSVSSSQGRSLLGHISSTASSTLFLNRCLVASNQSDQRTIFDFASVPGAAMSSTLATEEPITPSTSPSLGKSSIKGMSRVRTDLSNGFGGVIRPSVNGADVTARFGEERVLDHYSSSAIAQVKKRPIVKIERIYDSNTSLVKSSEEEEIELRELRRKMAAILADEFRRSYGRTS
jgi:hypothetical protein